MNNVVNQPLKAGHSKQLWLALSLTLMATFFGLQVSEQQANKTRSVTSDTRIVDSRIWAGGGPGKYSS